jgi:hypothetical protein
LAGHGRQLGGRCECLEGRVDDRGIGGAGGGGTWEYCGSGKEVVVVTPPGPRVLSVGSGGALYLVEHGGPELVGRRRMER